MFSERATEEQREGLVRQAESLDAEQRGMEGARLSAHVSYAVHRHHLEFHRRVAQGTQCGALVTLIESNRVLVFNWLFDLAAGDYLLPPHRELALLLCRADPAAAEEAMREHVRYGRHRMMSALTGRIPRGIWRERKPAAGAD